MPVIICRGCKSYAGKAINYITNKEKADRIKVHALDQSRSLSKQFYETAQLHGKGNSFEERKYYHIKISFEAKDKEENGGKLDTELAEKIAIEFLEKHYQGFEYVLAIHKDAKHVHAHAIINAVSFENGKKLRHSNYDLMQMKNEINDISEPHGVSRFDWQKAVKLKREKEHQVTENKKEHSIEEIYIKERKGSDWAKHSWKEMLRNYIDEAKLNCTNRAEFQMYLKKNYGIEMPRSTEKTVSFIHPAIGITVRGAKLGADYSSESIDKALSLNIERSLQNAGLHNTKEYTTGSEPTGEDAADTKTADDNNRPSITINRKNIKSSNEPVGSRIDESGECKAQADIGQLYNKLSDIRNIGKQHNTGKQQSDNGSDNGNKLQDEQQSKPVGNVESDIEPKHRNNLDEPNF